MTLKQNWADGNIVRASDLNDIATTINSVSTISAVQTKTSNFTAASGTLVPCDATTAAFTITLPSSAIDNARVIVKKIDSSSNAVTVACSGSDRLNKPGGATSLLLTLPNQVVTLQYSQYYAVWYAVSSDLPATSLGISLVGAQDAESARTILGTISSSDSRLSDQRTPSDGSVTSAKLDSTLLSSLVTLSGTQTLTGKTITSGKFNVISDTNGNAILGLSATSSSTNYLQAANAAATGSPSLSAVSSGDTNVNIALTPKGTGKLVVGGSAPTITSTGTNASLNLTSQGTGTVQANGVQIVDISSSQTLTGKTISGASNTLSNISQASVTGLAASLNAKAGATSGTDYELIGTGGKIAAGSMSSMGTSQSAFIAPKFSNDLAFHFLRGGTISVTKNGTAALVNVNYSATPDNAFSPKLQVWSLYPTATSDVFVIEVLHSYSVLYGTTIYGIDMPASQAAKNITIEAWNSTSSAWVSVGSVTDNTSGFYAKPINTVYPLTKVRYTLTNFISTTSCLISSLFAATVQGNGGSEYFFPRNGGSIYGTAALPPTITAAGGDANIALNLASKGNAPVRVNGYEVVTTQTLASLNLSGYVPLDSSGKIDPQYLPTTSYSATIGNGSATSFTVTHNLNTLDVSVSVWETATGTEVNCDIARTTNGTVVLTFATAPSLNAYRVVVLSSGGNAMVGTSGTPTTNWSISRLSSGATLGSTAGFKYIVLLDNSLSAPTLPNAIGNSSLYVLKNIHTASITVSTSAAQAIEGQPTLSLSSGASVELVSDGSNWRII